MYILDRTNKRGEVKGTNNRYMIIYKKKNGSLIYRIVKTIPKYKKGNFTSMGWYVEDVVRLRNGKTYSFSNYDSLLQKRLINIDISYFIGRNIISKIIEFICLYLILQLFL